MLIYTEPKKKMKPIQIILISVMITLLVVAGIYITYKKTNDYILQKEINASIQGANEVIYYINSNGVISILDNSTGDLTVSWTKLQDICGVEE